MIPLSVEHQDIVNTLRVRREVLGLTQRAVAGQMGIHPRNLCRLEKGDSTPHLGTLIQWARVLDCKIEVTVR